MVAAGAAVQAGVLSNEVKDILLLDVTPLSLGIETLGGVMTTLISKNTTIPTKKSESFSTAEDNQSMVSIHVLQGERSLARDNKTLGRFELRDIPPAPRGVPKIEVSFDIDSNGIIHVSAKNEATGKSQKIQIDKPSLNEEEINEMIKMAKVYEDQDRKRKEVISIKNELDQKIYQAEKIVKENKAKLKDNLVKETENSVKEAREYLKKEEMTVDEIRNFSKNLQDKLAKIGEVLYKQSSQDGSKEGAEAESVKVKPDREDKDNETINADYDKKEGS